MAGVPIDPAREEEELAAYLGDRFDRSRLVDYEGQLEREFVNIGDEALLYRTSEAYLYNLTAFAMTGTKDPYREVIERHVAPGARLLDYGCGIGSDGLALLEAGYEVTFADFDNPSIRYLRWRLARRGLDAAIVDLDAGVPTPGAFDLAYAFDVIEHVEDPFAFLIEMERTARMVLVNLLESPRRRSGEASETELHHALPVRALLRHCGRRRLRHYRRYHARRSHLVLYDSRRASSRRRLDSAIALVLGRLRRSG